MHVFSVRVRRVWCLAVLAWLGACASGPGAQAPTVLGQPVKPPDVFPANDREVRTLCEFETRNQPRGPGIPHPMSACQASAWRWLSERRRACHASLPNRKNDEIERCTREGTSFEERLQWLQQYEAFKEARSAAEWAAFLRRHGRLDARDPLGLVAEGRRRLAGFCQAVPAEGADGAAVREWLNDFSLADPATCGAAVARQQQRAYRLELAEARANPADRLLEIFVQEYRSNDPEALVPQAQAALLARAQARQQAALAAATTPAALDAFARRFAGAADVAGLVPQALARALALRREEQAALLLPLASWQALDAFVQRFGDDAESPVLARAQQRLALARDSELAALRALPLDALETRYLAERGQQPAGWGAAVLAELLQRLDAQQSFSAGLRGFKLSGDWQQVQRAVPMLRGGEDHDAALEALLAAATADQKPLAQRSAAAYFRQRNTAPAWLRAYQLSAQDSDLRTAGQRATTPREQARVEHELIKRVGLARVFSTSGQLASDGRSADISQPSGLLGLMKGVSASAKSVLNWQLRASPELGLKHGRYRVTLKLRLLIDEVTQSRVLGMRTARNYSREEAVNQTVVVDAAGRYNAAGRHSFQWSQSSQSEMLGGLMESLTETTGVGVKIEVSNVELVE